VNGVFLWRLSFFARDTREVTGMQVNLPPHLFLGGQNPHLPPRRHTPSPTRPLQVGLERALAGEQIGGWLFALVAGRMAVTGMALRLGNAAAG
jgi:hypothetical protein